MATLDYSKLGKVGYDAYKAHLHIPTYVTPDKGLGNNQQFKDLPVKVQQAWHEAALAISIEVAKRLEDDVDRAVKDSCKR